MIKIYVFGNPDFEDDTLALKVSKKLESKLKDIEFIMVNPNEDLPFVDEDKVTILDTVQGIDKISLISEKDLDRIQLQKSTTVHDYDLSFQLKYLKKLGKLKKFAIIGIPKNRKVYYLRIHSILRKLVAQDMQGS